MPNGVEIARRLVHFSKKDLSEYDRMKNTVLGFSHCSGITEDEQTKLIDSWLKAHIIACDVFEECEDPDECTQMIRDRINASDVDVQLIHRFCIGVNEHLEEEEQPDGSVIYKLFDDDVGSEAQSVSEHTDELSKLLLIDYVMMGGKTLSRIPLSGKILFPTARAFNEQIKLSNLGYDGKDITVGVTGKGKNQKEIKTGISIQQKLTSEHVMIQRAILTMFYNSGDTKPITVTPEQIYRVCCNLPSDATVNRENAEMIENAMDYLRSTPIVMDFSEQYEKFADTSKDEKHYHLECKVDTVMIHADKLTGIFSSESGSTIRVAYKILSRPTLCEYAGLFRQIKPTDSEMLAGKVDGDSSRNTFEANTIRSAVYSKIIAIKSPGYADKYEPTIRIDDIVSESRTSKELKPPTPRQRRTIISTIEQYLMFLVGKGEIKQFDQIKQGNKLIGYYIHVDRQKKKTGG